MNNKRALNIVIVKMLGFNLFKFICIFLIWTASFCSIYAQDPVFSQFYAAPLEVNPAFAGLGRSPRIGINYRNQWPFIEQQFKSYTTYLLSYDQYFKAFKSGLGFTLLADDAGDGLIKTIKSNVIYSYRVPLTKKGHYIKGGVELGLVNINYNWDKFTFGDQLDREFGLITGGGVPIISKEIRPAKTNLNYFDAGVGMMYYSPTFYIGVATKHINAPKIGILTSNSDGYNGLPLRFTVHSGFEWRIDKRLGKYKKILSPGVILTKQAQFFQVNLGTQYQFSTVFAGIWYRIARHNGDAVIGTLGFRKDFWKLTYSFDYTTSSLGIGLGGSHELSLLFNFESVTKEKKNISDCFDAFR